MRPDYTEYRERKLADCFTKGTWIILGIGFLCLAVDIYAIFFEPHYPSTAPGEPHIVPILSPAVVWTLEIVLALLAFWLIWIAFSKVRRARLVP